MRQYALERLLKKNRKGHQFELLEDGEPIARFREARHADVALEALRERERRICDER